MMPPPGVLHDQKRLEKRHGNDALDPLENVCREVLGQLQERLARKRKDDIVDGLIERIGIRLLVVAHNTQNDLIRALAVGDTYDLASEVQANRRALEFDPSN